MTQPSPSQPVLASGELYFGDNGRVFCPKHAGMTALYTGRDLSGQSVERVTEADRKAWPEDLGPLQCEGC